MLKLVEIETPPRDAPIGLCDICHFSRSRDDVITLGQTYVCRECLGKQGRWSFTADEERAVSESRIKDAFWKLVSYRCTCGWKKRPGFPFCQKCHSSLPESLRKRIYIKIRRMYVLAFEEAANLLPKQPVNPEPTPAPPATENTDDRVGTQDQVTTEQETSKP